MCRKVRRVFILLLLNLLVIGSLTIISSVAETGLERDLSASFGSEGDGFVIGKVTNKSANHYPCVRLQFYMIKQNRKSGFFSTEVRNIKPHSIVRYKGKLPDPVPSFGLDSIRTCRKGSSPKADKDKPKIVEFSVSPKSVKAGETVSISWKVQNAKSVQLYLDGVEWKPDRMSSNRWPSSMKEGLQTGIDRSTNFKLIASNGKTTTQKTVTVSVRTASKSKGTCTLSGTLTGKWRQEVQERFNGPSTTWIPDVGILSAATRKGVASMKVNEKTGGYKSKRLPAGSQYILRPEWGAKPRERTVSCRSGKNHSGINFKITGKPLID